MEKLEKIIDEEKSHNISYIVIGCNQEGYLDSCFSSIKTQNPAPFEIIYVDSSTDNSMKIARKYTPHVYFVEKKGPNPARNYGASKAKGDFLVFIDGNDELDPDAAKEINKAINEGIRVGPLSWATKIFSLREMLIDAVLNQFNYKGWYSCFVEKSLFEKVGGFEENIEGADDLATIGFALKGISPSKRIKARVYVNKDPFYKQGFVRRLFEWLK